MFSSAYSIKVSGFVKSPDGENVPYVLIIDSVNNNAVYSDNLGFYSFITDYKEQCLIFSHASFERTQVCLETPRDTFLTVVLCENAIDEVMVRGTSLSQQSMLGLSFLSRKTVQNLPSFFGEPDIIKAMTVLPGITNGHDLYSSIYVRGGNRDQNVFLMEGARFYSTSHAGGIVSMFNPDIISHIDIYKGIAPAKFGDGVSSVINISQVEGGNSGEISIDLGTLRSGFLLESKGDGKLYGFLAGRSSYLDLISGNANRELDFEKEEDEYMKINFWDIDGKLLYKPSSKTSISLNGHLGNDVEAVFRQSFSMVNETETDKIKSINGKFIQSKNITLNLRHYFENGLHVRNTSWFTNYESRHENSFNFSDFTSSNKIFERNAYLNDLSNRLELNYQIYDKHDLAFGTQISQFVGNLSEGKQIDPQLQIDTLFNTADQKACEVSYFLDYNLNLSFATKVRAGLRYSNFITDDLKYLVISIPQECQTISDSIFHLNTRVNL